MLTGAVELFLISLGLTYFMATTGAGLRVRLAAARPAAARLAAVLPVPPVSPYSYRITRVMWLLVS